MKVSVEKTPNQKMSQYAIDVATTISITHLPKTYFSQVVNAAIDINEIAGKAKAMPHIAARNIHTEAGLHKALDKAKEAGIDKVLVIGGSERKGRAFQGVDELYNAITQYDFEMYCGVYPQEEVFPSYKYEQFSKGITQLCFNSKVLNRWKNRTIVGVPTNCSINGLLKYMRLCGLTESFKHIIGNLEGIQYINKGGFNTSKFVSRLNHEQIHLYNFGRLDQTLRDLGYESSNK
jgi:5,10-methylenetetrahydrofolate reductase